LEEDTGEDLTLGSIVVKRSRKRRDLIRILSMIVVDVCDVQVRQKEREAEDSKEREDEMCSLVAEKA